MNHEKTIRAIKIAIYKVYYQLREVELEIAKLERSLANEKLHRDVEKAILNFKPECGTCHKNL